jgi:cell division cycle protein 20 (cofactor of APC complex)
LNLVSFQATRFIPQVPDKILDAPELLDDYYLNLLDWSSTNMLSVALGQTVYLWNASSGGITELAQVSGENYITSVNWVQTGGYLAVGTAEGEVQLYDAETMQLKRRMGGHSARVGSLSWNNHIVSSGGRDSLIINHDVRVRKHDIHTMQGVHDQEVCGLKWSPDGTQLASGGNDNLMCVWELGVDEPKLRRAEHTAAVKALAWCPWQSNLLASGGGTSDRKIRFWNTSTGACLNVVDTHSQVCSLLWSKHSKELVSSHGFSQNQVSAVCAFLFS